MIRKGSSMYSNIKKKSNHHSILIQTQLDQTANIQKVHVLVHVSVVDDELKDMIQASSARSW